MMNLSFFRLIPFEPFETVLRPIIAIWDLVSTIRLILAPYEADHWIASDSGDFKKFHNFILWRLPVAFATKKRFWEKPLWKMVGSPNLGLFYTTEYR